jgi:hypothetical protein
VVRTARAEGADRNQPRGAQAHAPSAFANAWAARIPPGVSQRCPLGYHAGMNTFSRWWGAALVLVSTAAHAQATPPRLIPYTGKLERNGVALSGSLEVRFCLVRAVDHSCQNPQQSLWSETHTVTFTAGQFNVTLGALQALPDALMREPELYVGVVLTPSASPVEIGRQRLHATPYAITAAQGTNLVASQELRVGIARPTGAVEAAGSGPRLVFSGGPVLNSGVGSENSDPLWMERHNRADNQTDLRVNIGDDPGSARDRLVVGVAPGGTFNPLLTVESNGDVTASGRVTASTVSVTGTALGSYSVLASGVTPASGAFNQEFNAASDGMVVVWIYGDANGARGMVEGYVDPDGSGGQAEFAVAKDTYHYFTNTDVYVRDASITFPVGRNMRFRVVVSSSSGQTVYVARWIALHP